MTDAELFDPKRIAARQAEAAAELALVPPFRPDAESPEAVAVAATLDANGMTGDFAGVYPGARTVAGYKAPDPPKGE